jgi:crossover junction endodeoxyribonuclease RuvC
VQPRRIYIGIDPGKSGAVAVLGPGSEVLLLADVVVDGAKPPEYRPDAMADLLRPFAGCAQAMIEIPQAPRMRDSQKGRGELRQETGGQGVGSGRQGIVIGRGAGLWEGICAGLDIPVQRVQSTAWKRFYGLSSDKELSRLRAIALFPHRAERLARKKDDGRAEALLIAFYLCTTCEDGPDDE